MLELRADGPHWSLGHASDVFNTSVYLARFGENVAFVTALGDDCFSDTMRSAWQQEGLRLDFVLTAQGALPGLYAIQTDDDGERVFYYWREQAAVRHLFRLPAIDEILDQAVRVDLLYMSGITLALFDARGREILIELARGVRRAGGMVAFDPNYRPSLWASPCAAKEAFANFAAVTTIALPTFDDEAALHDDPDPMTARARWQRAGVENVVIKLNGGGCMDADGRIVTPFTRLQPVDTTGAGDAFNAAYLAAIRRGLTPAVAAEAANAMGGLVTQYRGAIMPRADMPSFETLLLQPSAGPVA